MPIQPLHSKKLSNNSRLTGMLRRQEEMLRRTDNQQSISRLTDDEDENRTDRNCHEPKVDRELPRRP
jgi:hypothetical protein